MPRKSTATIPPMTIPPQAPKAKPGKAPTTHTHRCLADGGHTWAHADPCDGPKFRTRLCPAHQTPTHAEPAALVAEPAPETPAPETPAPTSPDRPATTIIHVGRRDITRTPAMIGQDGARLFARAWDHGKGYVPTLVVRTRAGVRTVYAVGEPMASKADALAEAERVQAQHIAQQTLPMLVHAI